MKNLENFINMHRAEFDTYQPTTNVWAGISSGLTAPSLISRLAKFFGKGSMNTILASAVLSAMLVGGIWAYQGNSSQKADSASVSQPAKAENGQPASAENSQMPAAAGQQTPVENGGYTEAGTPAANDANPHQESGYALPASSVDTRGDSSYKGIKSLMLKSYGYNFKIRRSNVKTTQVRILTPGKVIDKETNKELVLKVEQNGSELVFEYEGDEARQKRGTNYETVNKGEIEVLVPDGDLNQITSSSSSIDLSAYTTPALTIKTASGNVNATDVKAKLNISSASGNQELSEITGNLKCRAASGNISLKNLHGNVDTETSSGLIELQNAQGDMTCKSASGNIQMNTVQGKLELSTVSGSISGEAVSLVESCNVEAVSGNIDLALKNSGDDLSFDLSSLSGRMKVKKGSTAEEGKRSLKAGSGKIQVTGKTVSGQQVYR